MAATILIVDDEPHLLRLLVRVFEREGYTVLSSDTGDKAVDLFLEHEAEIDAMVLDVIIPPRGARDVLENVLARRPDISLVLASGDDPPDDLRKTLEGCGGRFVRKPFLPGNLVATVAELVAASAGGVA
jgi:two-component system cell cycle sensor histidine kinase/response regulator CckA